MNDTIKKAIKILTEKITKDVPSPAALSITQAALNLAHTIQVLNQNNKN